MQLTLAPRQGGALGKNFSNLALLTFWTQDIFCRGDCLVQCRIWAASDHWPLDASSTIPPAWQPKMSPDVAACVGVWEVDGRYLWLGTLICFREGKDMVSCTGWMTVAEHGPGGSRWTLEREWGLKWSSSLAFGKCRGRGCCDCSVEGHKSSVPGDTVNQFWKCWVGHAWLGHPSSYPVGEARVQANLAKHPNWGTG